MTVGELITALSAFDPALPVLVSGYENGFNEPAPAPSLELVYDDIPTAWHTGRYQPAGSDDALPNAFNAVVVR